MRRILIQRAKVRPDRPLVENLAFDPRDPDVVRAKAIGRRDQRQQEAPGR